ncbi:MAG TPA: enoyl-CoA hydratase-related protein [Mycobacteriales bacterium]|jgi:methylglutaconyl-CoA hydratase|nr:enoyl-CoA hydratase-related protein [Mycobacteriales bacterium]
MGDHLRGDFGAGITTITLDSQHNRNALSGPLLREFVSELERIDLEQTRVVVLRHVGPAFCSGVDLRAGDVSAMAELPPLLESLWNLSAPVIAVIDGAVRGGGMGIIATADIVLSTPESSFGLSEVRIGVTPTTIWPLVAQRLVPSAQYLALTGEAFDGLHAARVGFVTETHSGVELEAELDRYVNGILCSAPNAVAATKRMLRLHSGPLNAGDDLSAVLDPLAEDSIARFQSPEAEEGIAAFLEKRSPRWAPQRA